MTTLELETYQKGADKYIVKNKLFEKPNQKELKIFEDCCKLAFDGGAANCGPLDQPASKPPFLTTGPPFPSIPPFLSTTGQCTSDCPVCPTEQARRKIAGCRHCLADLTDLSKQSTGQYNQKKLYACTTAHMTRKVI